MITNVDEYILFTNGGESSRYGVGFLGNNDLEESVVKFIPVSG